MDDFYARSVFFVKDAEAALAFYTKNLGFELDWNHQYEGRAATTPKTGRDMAVRSLVLRLIRR
jgi:catechol 2,3-dioxygenase-like lactoylglutathione lyase family enzyme